MDKQDRKYITVKDIMRELGISKNTAYKLIHENGLPYVTVGGQMRIRVADYNDWALANRVDESQKKIHGDYGNCTGMMLHELASLTKEEMKDFFDKFADCIIQYQSGQKVDYPIGITEDTQRCLDHWCDMNGIKKNKDGDVE